MGLKTNKCCCCEPCEARTGQCCQCAPPIICVKVTGPGSETCPCEMAQQETAWSTTTNSYSDAISCGSIAFAYEIFFRAVDGQCKIAIRSDCLGYPEGSEHLIDVAPSCRDFDVSFTANAAGCGDADCTSIDIQIVAAQHFLPSCDGCDCVCKCVCLSVSRFGEPVLPLCNQTVYLCRDGGEWSTTVPCDDDSIDVAIILDGNVNGACVLKLQSNSLGISFDDTAYWKNVNCPEITAQWALGDIYTEEMTFISIRCSRCVDCVSVNCCNFETLPETLTVTLVSGCPGADGSAFTLTRDPNDGDWKYSGPWDGPCPIEIPLFNIGAACGGDPDTCQWTLSYSNSCCLGALIESDPYACSCDPLEVVFEDQTGGTQCCGDDPLNPQSHDWVWVLTQ